jgi:hypothetical protein
MNRIQLVCLGILEMASNWIDVHRYAIILGGADITMMIN